MITWRTLDVSKIDLKPRIIDPKTRKPKIMPGARTGSPITYDGQDGGFVYQFGSIKDGTSYVQWNGPKFWDQTVRKFPAIENCFDFRPFEDGQEHDKGVKLSLEFPLKDYQSDEPDNYQKEDFEAMLKIRDRIFQIISDRWEEFLPFKMDASQLVSSSRGPLDFDPSSEYAPTIKASVHMNKCAPEDSVHGREHLYVDISEVKTMPELVDGEVIGGDPVGSVFKVVEQNGKKRRRELRDGRDVDILCGRTRNIFAVDFSMVFFKKAEINFVPPVVTICSEPLPSQKKGADLV